MEARKAKKLALFDLDGTLTRKDTMIEFIRFVRGDIRLYLSYVLLSPVLVAYKLGFYPNDKAKKALLRHHFGGANEEWLKGRGVVFCKRVLPRMFREIGLEKYHFHRAKGHEVFVITASLDIWTEPWFKQQGLKYISTRAKWEGGRFTGEFETPNCYGPEKVRRLKAVLDTEQFERIYAYGDSKGDREMLDFADRGFYRKFT